MELLFLALIALCIALEGFFSGSEIAVVSLSKLELQKRLKEKERSALLLARLLQEPERLLSTTLIGTNLSTVTASVIFTATLANQISLALPALKDYPEALTVLCLTPFTLTFGELIPKSLSQKHSHRFAFAVAYPLHLFYVLFKPISLVAMKIAGSLSRGPGAQAHQSPFVTKEELRLLVESSSRLKIEETERDILKNILKLKEKRLGSIYVPLSDVVALEEGSPVKEVVRLAEGSGHSKFPVYSGRFDNITGYISILDILNTQDISVRAGALKKPVLIFTEYTNMLIALKEFEGSASKMAVVVDEYGSTLGIVTPEDILEEIVGKIEDEFDRQPPEVTRLNGELLVRGSVEVKELNRHLKKPVPESSHYSTLAGYILMHTGGRVPRKGEKVKIGNLELRIESSTPRRIELVRVKEIN